MLPKRFLFQFSFPCLYTPSLWSGKGSLLLNEKYRIQSLQDLEEKTPRMNIDFRMAWNEKEIGFSLAVSGKKAAPFFDPQAPEDSDGIQICLDTRDVRNVHRATRYCHRLAFLPVNDRNAAEPSVHWLPIHRAKTPPNPIAVEKISVRSAFTKDGYQIAAKMPSDVLTGYDPIEHSRIGLHYVVFDHENGNQAMLTGEPFPSDSDPSLWATLALQTGNK